MDEEQLKILVTLVALIASETGNPPIYENHTRRFLWREAAITLTPANNASVVIYLPVTNKWTDLALHIRRTCELMKVPFSVEPPP